MMEKKDLINEIENELLEFANLFNEVTTSDLQGIAAAKAEDIFKLIMEENNVNI